MTSKAQELLKLELTENDKEYLLAQSTIGDIHYPQMDLWFTSTHSVATLEQPVRDVVARIIIGESN